MATETAADREFAEKVSKHVAGFSPRKARELRAREAITGGGSGGKGKVTPYTDDDVFVAVEIERAKSEDEYKSKLERAILIAYARHAPVRTEGLRRAWTDEFRRSEVPASKVLDGERIRDESWLDMPPQERNAAAGLFAHMLMGEEPSPELVRDGLAARLPEQIAAANDLVDAIVADATPDELQSVETANLKEDREYAGLLKKNENDTWNAKRNGNLTAMPEHSESSNRSAWPRWSKQPRSLTVKNWTKRETFSATSATLGTICQRICSKSPILSLHFSSQFGS